MLADYPESLPDAIKVAEFTQASMPDGLPDRPKPLDREGMRVLCKMVISELMEGASTVTEDPVGFVKECLNTDLPQGSKKFGELDLVDTIAEQADFVVDACYYMYNWLARYGINAAPVMEAVHKANMDKRFPDGKFHRRPEDNKIIKPDGWKEPDLRPIIQHQIDNGSWVHPDI